MKKTVLFILLGAIALGSCKKVVKVEDLDKEIDLTFGGMDRVGNSSTTFNNDPTIAVLKDFDKRDYKHIDSITFNISFYTEVANDTVYARLYNITDQVEIANSIVTGSPASANKYFEFHSNNILSSLPDKRIDLGIQIRNTIPGKFVNSVNPYLKLRRN